MKRQRNKGGLIATLLLAGVLGTSAYAFTASNTISNPGNAGDGTSGSMSGYTISNVHYGSVGGTNVESVTFDISPAVSASGTVKAAVSDNSTPGALSSACTDNGGGTNFTCDVSGNAVSIAASDNLRVVAFG
jgi:hypothetical protein